MAPRLKSRMKATEPFHWKGRTTRSSETALVVKPCGGRTWMVQRWRPACAEMTADPEVDALDVVEEHAAGGAGRVRTAGAAAVAVGRALVPALLQQGRHLLGQLLLAGGAVHVGGVALDVVLREAGAERIAVHVGARRPGAVGDVLVVALDAGARRWGRWPDRGRA